METGLFAAFSKKVISTIIAVGSMFYSTIDGVTPNLSIPEIKYKNDYVYVSTILTNCFTEEFEQILHSGNSVPFYYSVEIYQNGADLPDSVNTFFHSIRYSPIGNDFSVYYSETNEVINSLSLNQAKTLLSQAINYRVASFDNFKENTTYYIAMSAWLDKLQMEGMEEELNLLYYWNSIKPESSSTQFTKADFQI